MNKNKILVLNDLEDFTQVVAEKSLKIADEYNKELDVLYVEDESFLKLFKEKAEDSLAKNKTKLEALYENNANIFCKHGNFLDVVDSHIKENDISGLIVGFRRERTFLEDIFNGSNLSKIVRKFDIPIFVIKTEDEPEYKNILIPSDLSNSSKKNIEHLVTLFPNANFYIEHYYRTLLEHDINKYGIKEKEVKDYLASYEVEAKKELDTFVDTLEIPAETKVFKKVKNFLNIKKLVDESIDTDNIDLLSLCISTDFSIFSFDLLESSKKDVIIYKILEKF